MGSPPGVLSGVRADSLIIRRTDSDILYDQVRPRQSL